MDISRQNEVIADLCGWKKYPGASLINYMWAPGHMTQAVPKWYRGDVGNLLNVPPDNPRMEIPNFTGSYEDAHDAIKTLFGDARDPAIPFLMLRFEENLRESLGGCSATWMIIATPAELMKALLEALDRWEDE